MKKEVNSMVGFWSFLFVIAIGLKYLNEYVWNTREDILFNGGYVLSFFMFLFGYKLISHFKNSKSKSDNAAKKAWKYELENIKNIYPFLLLGVSLAFVVRNMINGTKLWQLFGIFMNSIWEFLGLSQIGIVGIHEIKSITVDNVLGFSHLWNQPLWILSCLLICGYFIYYIIAKNEDFFKNVFAPLLIIITYASFGVGNASNFSLSFVGIPWSLLRVSAGISVGVWSYYLINYLKKKKFSENMLLIFSFFHIGCAIYFLFTIYAGISWSEFTNGLIMLIFFIVLMVNKDYVADLYNNFKIGDFFMEISKYYYVIFIVFVFLLAKIFPELNYGFSIFFNVLFSLGLSVIIYSIKWLINNSNK